MSPGEHQSKDKWMEMAHECAKDMGFENNQFVAFYHKNTSHDHLHIVTNRVGFDVRTVSDNNNPISYNNIPEVNYNRGNCLKDYTIHSMPNDLFYFRHVN